MATIKITKRTADGFGSDGSPSIVWDSNIAGFGLRLRSKGKKYFVLKYRINGRQRWYTIGLFGSPWTVDTARQEAKRLLVEVANGVDPAAARDTNRNAKTVADLCDLYMENHAKLHKKPSSWKSDESNIHNHVKKLIGHLNANAITRQDIEKFKRDVANRLADQTSIDAIRLLIFTGCRLSEILTLKWKYVDFQRNSFHLPDSKTGAKTVYLPDTAISLLKELPRMENNSYVLVGTGEKGHMVNLRKPWHRIREKTGLADVRLHDLRHSFASIAAGEGMSLHIIGQLLGHSHAATTARYAHLAANPMKAAADKIGTRIDSLMNGSDHIDRSQTSHAK